jgi:hypothetical protein
MAKKEKTLPSWRVTRIAGKAARGLGTYQAGDADQAVKKAIAFFGIPAEEQSRLAAYRVA